MIKNERITFLTNLKFSCYAAISCYATFSFSVMTYRGTSKCRNCKVLNFAGNVPIYSFKKTHCSFRVAISRIYFSFF